MGRLQRGYPRQIPNRLGRQTDRQIYVLRKTVDRPEIALEKAGMKADERNGGNHRREMAEEDLEPATRHGAGCHRRRTGDERGPLVLVDGDRRRCRVPKKTEEAERLRRKKRRLRQIDDEADALDEKKRLLHVGGALLPRPPDHQYIVEVPNRANAPEMKKAFEKLRHPGEDKGGEAEAERQDPELPHPTAPTEAKEAARRWGDGDVKIGVLEIDGRRPVPGTQKKSNVLHCVHPEMRTIDEELVQFLQIDDRPPPDWLRHEKKSREKAEGGKGDLLYGSLSLQRLHLRVDEIHMILARDDRK